MRAALLSVWLCCGTAFAREVPVSDPEALRAAIAAARPGDEIVLAEGTWTDTEIVFRARGTTDAPVTLRAALPGKVVLDGNSSLRFVGEHLVVDGLLFAGGLAPTGHIIAFRGDSDEEASDCRLTHTAIVNEKAPADPAASSKWVSLYGARNRVDHCEFRGKRDRGPVLVVWLNGRPNDHRIEANLFADRPVLGKNGGEIIRIGDSKTSMEVSRTVVAHNLFEDCDGEAEIVSNKSCENIYRHNTFRRCAGALTLRHGNRCLVEANYFLGEGKAGTGGIRIIGAGHQVLNNYLADLAGEEFFSAIGFMACIPNSEPSGYLEVRDAVVAFNTVINCRNSLYFGVGFGSRGRILPARDTVLANNVIVHASAPPVIVKVAPVHLRQEGNIVFGPGGEPQDGLTVADPRLIRGEDGLWRPGPGSPALASATGNFPQVTADILGRPRPADKDAGCIQRSPSAVRFPPLAVRDVGPAWRNLR